MSTFRLNVVTPTRDFYSGEVEYVSIGTPDGREGFLSGALPRVAVLSDGLIEVRTSVLEMRMICGGGIVSVTPDGVTVLTESCRFEDDAPSEDGDTARADESVKLAKAKLGTSIKNMKKRRGTDVK